MGIEIERKFCVKETPNLANQTGTKILQGYITDPKDSAEVRLRSKGDLFFQTIKAGQGLTRQETEVEINQDQFETLWPLTTGRRVEKIRYEIVDNKKTIELDIYLGSLDGLVIAEVEFDTQDESQSYTPPPWFGDEVTEDTRYKNATLAIAGRPNG